MNQSDAKLLYELGERARVLLHSYFRSPSGLFVTFTHLVCRSAVAGNSKMIHSQNSAFFFPVTLNMLL